MVPVIESRREPGSPTAGIKDGQKLRRDHVTDARFAIRGFSLIELLLVIAIISLLAALTFPVFARAAENARATSCQSNQKQIGSALAMYVQDYDETFPMNRFADANHAPTACLTFSLSAPSASLEGSSVNWKRVVMPYVQNHVLFQCPSNAYAWKVQGFNHFSGDESNLSYARPQWLPASYALNTDFFHEAVPLCWYGETAARPRQLAEIASPSALIMMVESRYNYPDLGAAFIHIHAEDSQSKSAFQLHNGFGNFLFADQHSKRHKLSSTCVSKMWSDRYVDRSGGCESIEEIPQD